MKLRDIRFDQSVQVDGAMVDRVAAGEATAFGVVVGADLTLVPWTNVRWAKRADVVVFEKPVALPSEALGLGQQPKGAEAGEPWTVAEADHAVGVVTVKRSRKAKGE